MKMQLGITAKLTLVFVLYAAVLLASVGALAYYSGRAALKERTLAELQAVAAEKEGRLEFYLGRRLADLASLAGSPYMIADLETMQSAWRGLDTTQEARDRLASELKARLTSRSDYVWLALLDPETGEVLVASDPMEEGKFSAYQPYFVNGRNGPYVYSPSYLLTNQSPFITVAAPVRAAGDRLLAVVAGQIDLDEIGTIIQGRTGLHLTDEAFLVNTSNLFVTQPRLLEVPAVLQRAVHTQAERRCLGEQANGGLLATDYRGVPVASAYRWLPDLKVCLIVKLDQAEAFGPSRAFGQTILVVSLAALIIVSLVAVGLAGSIVRPLHALQAGVVRFGRGELSARLPEASGDELGVLAREFNKMAAALAEEQTYLRRRAEQFFNLALDMLCTASFDGYLVDLNPAWEQALGYSREELRAHPLIDFVHRDDAAPTTAALRRISQDSATVHFENRCRHKDGSYRWLAWAVVASPQDQLLYAAARDVTQRRLAEETLRQQAEELARSNKELEQFAYVASHDLQEPLHIVSSYVQLLARRYRGQLDQEADEFITFAVEGAKRMKTLIDALLAFSRVGTRSKDFAPVAMDEVFDRALSNLQLVIEESGATVTHDPLPLVLADGVQMTQLMQNLVSNAVKFRSQEPSWVHVSARREGDQWLCSVRDNGIGIDPQYNERIFVIFQRLHSRDEYPGTGIGLALCRKIVERHGGHIWVESEPGKGATFYFTLRPVERVTAESEAAWPEGAKPRAKDAVAERATDLV